ncbi:MAG: hypothetical protein ABFR97_08120 [Thermodesulfobacteriota bacterium]
MEIGLFIFMITVICNVRAIGLARQKDAAFGEWIYYRHFGATWVRAAPWCLERKRQTCHNKKTVSSLLSQKKITCHLEGAGQI